MIASSARQLVVAHDQVVIDVGHARQRVLLTRNLMNIAWGGQPRTDVDKLPDARVLGQEPDGPAHETPVRPRRRQRIGHHRQQLVGGLPVISVVVLTA